MINYIPFEAKSGILTDEERKRLEASAYNEELDLWNTTILARLERERIFKEIFERK